MNANMVNILSWSKPPKTAAALLSINLILWVLIRQRPFYILPMVLLLWYCRNLWRNRIRPEVLIDPPDHEDWINLSTYDLQLITSKFVVDMFLSWRSFRHTNHLMWTVGTCTGWIILAKIGMELDFLTLLFLLSNAAFLIYPIMDHFPIKMDTEGDPYLGTSSNVRDEPEPPVINSRATRSGSAPPIAGALLEPVLVSAPGPAPAIASPSSPFYDFYEGIVTRSLSAVSMAPGSQAARAQFQTSLSSLTSTLTATSALFSATVESEEGPESLSPSIAQMPGVEEALEASDDEDEFLFDAKHFDKSSSSTSVSTSFEIIDDEEREQF